MDAENYKNVSPQFLDFCKISKIHKKKYYKIQGLFCCYYFILYKEKMLTDGDRIKN